MADEIETHRAMRQSALERDGLSSEDAARESRRALGNVLLSQEDAAAVWRWTQVDRLWQDIRYGARLLLRQPGFTTIAVLTMALGLGANTAMFSVVQAVLLRPLPYLEPDRLVMIWMADPARGIREAGTSYPTAVDWQRQNRTLTSLALWAEMPARIYTGRDPERITAVFAASDLFPLLGVQPAIGRTFTADEESRRDRVVVLSHAFWQRQFGGDASVIGRLMTLEEDSALVNFQPLQSEGLRIIGVMPPGFQFPTPAAQLWVPSTLMGLGGKRKLYENQWTDRYTDRWRVIGRLKPDATWQDAQSDLTLVGQRLAGVFPMPVDRDAFPGFGVDVVPLREQMTGRTLRLALWVLLGAVGSVLLIACANVANLLLARGAGRKREFAIRCALGAGRGRLVRQLLVESGLVAVGGATLGVAGAAAGIRLLAGSATGIPRLDEVSIDSTVLVFTAGVSVVAGLLFGLAPAWSAAKANGAGFVPDRHSAGAAGTRRLAGWLIVAECAIAVVLLTGAGLLMRSFERLQSVDPGFDPRGVLLVRLDLVLSVGPGWREQEWATFQQIEERVRALPGVIQAGFIQNFLIASHPRTPVTIEGRSAVNDTNSLSAVNTEDVSPGFFRAMGVPLRQGRFFDYTEQNAPIAIVNDEFVRRYLPEQNPIGRRFVHGSPDPRSLWHTIVGVVGDMHRQGLERKPIPEFFIPSTEPSMELAVRMTGDPASGAAAVREVIRSIHPQAIVMRMTPVDAFLGELSAERRFHTRLLAFFALAALVLSAIGVYGIVQVAVGQQRRDLGIRIAMGANRGDLMRLVVRQGVRLPLIGLAVGLGAALLLTRVLMHLLFEVSAYDPATFAGVALVLLLVALVASFLPARRAARIDPVIALKTE